MQAPTAGSGETPGAGQPADQRSSHLAQLLVRAGGGDVDAFADMYEATSSRTYGTVLRVLRAPQHAAEVVQEVWQQATTYSPGRGSAMGWILTLAHRVDAGLAVEPVRRGLQQLSPLQRQSLQLAYDGGYSQSQIAHLLDLPLGTVKARVRDGLTAPRGHLREER